MTFPRLVLSDRSETLCAAWEKAFDGVDAVDVRCGDFFGPETDALVSPANSFGYMDGGLDAAIRAHLGVEIEVAVQSMIVERFHGEMPVGTAAVVETGSPARTFLVVAPTMRVPENVAHTLNAYLAFRALLVEVARFNAGPGGARISSLTVPGLCTGWGAMDAERCAAQMRIAYAYASQPARTPGAGEIHDLHAELTSA